MGLEGGCMGLGRGLENKLDKEEKSTTGIYKRRYPIDKNSRDRKKLSPRSCFTPGETLKFPPKHTEERKNLKKDKYEMFYSFEYSWPEVAKSFLKK